MRNYYSIFLVLAMVFSVAACGTSDEIVKDKKLSKANADTYLNVEVSQSI